MTWKLLKEEKYATSTSVKKPFAAFKQIFMGNLRELWLDFGLRGIFWFIDLGMNLLIDGLRTEFFYSSGLVLAGPKTQSAKIHHIFFPKDYFFTLHLPMFDVPIHFECFIKPRKFSFSSFVLSMLQLMIDMNNNWTMKYSKKRQLQS